MIIISIIFIVFCLESLLSVLEINHIKSKASQGFLSAAEFAEFKNIALTELKFKIFSNFLAFIVNSLFILFIFNLLLPIFAPDSLLDNTLLVLLYFLISSCVFSCLNYYKTIVIDTKNGFNKKTPKMYLVDLFKSLILLIIFGGAVIIAMLFAIAKLADFWWLGGFFVLLLTSLLAQIIYPNFIVPIFNKLSPIEGALKDDIQGLLSKCDFKSSGVFSMDASKNDTRLNAYFAGLFSAKKVVLYDTLICALDKAELLAVLAHELGHFKHKDIFKMLFLNALNLFIIFAIFGYFSSFFASDLGLASYLSSPLFAFIIVSQAFFFFLFPITNSISRKNEFSADLHGAKMCGKQNMQNALKILAIKNKALLDSHQLYEFIYKSHPSLSKRIKALDASDL